MNRRLIAFAAVLVIWITAFAHGAGKSDVADAAMKGDRTAMRALLAQKADVNAPQVDGATALHWALYRDDAEMADVLIRAGANVKAANRDGVTPLAMAALYGKPAMILKLLKGGRADGADARGAERQSRRGEGLDRRRREREREGNASRHDGAHVGRRAEASRRREGAAGRRSRREAEVGGRGSSAKLSRSAGQHGGRQAGGGALRQGRGKRADVRGTTEVGAGQRRVQRSADDR